MPRKAIPKYTIFAEQETEDKCKTYMLKGNKNFEFYRNFAYSEWTPNYILERLSVFLDGKIQLAMWLDDNNILYHSCNSNSEYILTKDENNIWSCECTGYNVYKNGYSEEPCHHVKETLIYTKS